MSKNHSICVGATGFGGGVWHSPDGGDNWTRIRDPFPLGSQVRAMAVHIPTTPIASWPEPTTASTGARTRAPPGRSSGLPWTAVPIWSIAIDPEDTDTVFVGIKPAALFRSRDDGAELGQALRPDGSGMPHRPTDGDHADGGSQRTTARSGPASRWTGSTAVSTAATPGPTLRAGYIRTSTAWPSAWASPTGCSPARPREIYATTDMGESWESVVTTDQFVLPYSRGIAVKPDDPNVIFAGVGDTAIGGAGAIQRSDGRRPDLGAAALCRWSPIPTSGSFATHAGGPRFRAWPLASWVSLYSSRRRGRFVGQGEP